MSDSVSLGPTRVNEWVQHVFTAAGMAERLCRAKGVYGDEAEDFASWVRLRLIENDYSKLKKYRGESGMESYLAAVVANLFRDYCDKLWGKWRPSASAKRIGPLAIALERSVYRDGLTLAMAAERLRARGFDAVTDRMAAELFARLPVRQTRRLESLDSVGEISDPVSAEHLLKAAERSRERTSVLAAVERALASLPAEDRTIIELRFREGLSVADVARALHLEQKPLYRRVDRLLRELRKSPELQGVSMDGLME